MEKTKDTELTPNQKHLMSVAGRVSVVDWDTNLGDERLRMSRVMVAKLIRIGGEDVLKVVAEYLGTKIIPDEEVTKNLELWNKMFKNTYTFESVHAILMKRHR